MIEPETADPAVFASKGPERHHIRTTPDVDLTGWSLFTLWNGSSYAASSSPIELDAGGAWCSVSSPPKRLQPDVLLAIASPDGHRIGMLEVPWSEDPRGRSLHFILEEVGSIEVDVELETRPGPVRAFGDSFLRHVRVERRVPKEPLGMAWRIAQKRFLPPGSYRVTASAREHAKAQVDVDVRPGRTTRVPMKLSFAEGARSIHGRIVNESGDDLPALGAFIVIPDHLNSSWHVSYFGGRLSCVVGLDHLLRVKDWDRSSGTFTLPRVPPGDLQIYLSHVSNALRITSSERADGDVELEIRLLEESAPGAGFRLGEHFEPELSWLPPTWEITPLDGGPMISGNCTNGAVVMDIDLARRPFRWTVRHSGHRTVHGDHTDFVDAGNGRFFADAPLIPGWSTEVRVADQHGSPIRGAEVLSEGVLLGVTNASGSVYVDAKTMPERLEVIAVDGARRGPSKTVPGASLMGHWVTVILD